MYPGYNHGHVGLILNTLNIKIFIIQKEKASVGGVFSFIY